MAEPTPIPSTSTFVVRFWREGPAAELRWRGRIEHVQSGQSASFLSLEDALAFVRSLGVMADLPASPQRGQE
jgi:hypothetical protein